MWFATRRHYPTTRVGNRRASRRVQRRACSDALVSACSPSPRSARCSCSCSPSRRRGARCLPAAAASAYLGVALAWGFVAVGLFAWLRRPDNRTGVLMLAVGLVDASRQACSSPTTRCPACSGRSSTRCRRLLIHLLLAFPSGRLEGPAARIIAAAGYVIATVLHAAAAAVGLIKLRGIAREPAGRRRTAPFSRPRRARAGGDRRHARAADPALARREPGRAPRARARAAARARAIVALGGVVPQARREGKAAQLAFLSALALLPAAFLARPRAQPLLPHRGRRAADRAARAATAAPAAARRAARGARRSDARRSPTGCPTRRLRRPRRRRWRCRRRGDGRAATEIAPRRPARRRARARERACATTPELLREAAGAAALALENGRLEVELRARLEALRASRARIVEAGDAERRRLTRDLHDGAQQRLVSLMIDLQLARERWDAEPAEARELRRRARSTTRARRSRSCASWPSGIHPAVLAQRGLDAALESLATRAPLRSSSRRSSAGGSPARSRPPPTSSSPRR